MRLLVCGGREFDDVPWLWRVLDGIHARAYAANDRGIECLIDGAQVKTRKDGSKVGADHWAHEWACARDVPTERYFADWEGLGKKAGPLRNQRMLDEGKPTHLLAMPGGRGTANMVSIASLAGVRVRIEVSK